MKKKTEKSITTISMNRTFWDFENSSIPIYLKRIYLSEFKEDPGEPDEFHYDFIVGNRTKMGKRLTICFVRYGEIYLDL